MKLVLADERGQAAAQASRPLPLAHPHPLWSEQNPSDWWDAAVAAAQDLKRSHGAQLSSVKGVGLSGQMHGAVLLDAKGQVLRPAILWNDGRSAKECLALQARAPRYASITGNALMPGFTAPKLVWVARHEKSVFDRIAHVLLPKDYLRWKMSRVLATDMSDASGTCWLNVAERRWSHEMVEATGMTMGQLPDLFEGTEWTGRIDDEAAEALGVPPCTPIAAGGGDNAAGAVSVQVVQAGSGFLSLGTSGVYFVCNDGYRPNERGGVHTYCHCLPSLWHQMTVHLSAASCLAWFAKIAHASIEELLDEAESSGAASSPVQFLPYLQGERTPYNDPYARALFFGMGADTERRELTLSVLEGVAQAFAQGQKAMVEAGTAICDVCVVGGGAKSLFWGSILASALDRQLTYRCDREVGAALGAARLACLAHSQGDPATAFAPPPVEAVVSPNNARAQALAGKAVLFRLLYERLKDCFAHEFQPL